MSDDIRAGKALRTIASEAHDHSLETFRLGMTWAATLIGGSEFPGVPDRGADIIAPDTEDLAQIILKAVNLGS